MWSGLVSTLKGETMNNLNRPRVHTLPKGQHIAPMPALRQGELGARRQGGLPPEPYRTATTRWATCPAMSARDPMKRIVQEYKGKREWF